MLFHVYILRCNDGSYYIGHTDKDIEIRVEEHQQNKYGGYKASGEENSSEKGSGAKIEDGKVKVLLPPYSYQMLRLKV